MRRIGEFENVGIFIVLRRKMGLLEDGKLDYLYLLKGETMGGIADGRIFTVQLCLADRIVFE